MHNLLSKANKFARFSCRQSGYTKKCRLEFNILLKIFQLSFNKERLFSFTSCLKSVSWTARHEEVYKTWLFNGVLSKKTPLLFVFEGRLTRKHSFSNFSGAVFFITISLCLSFVYKVTWQVKFRKPQKETHVVPKRSSRVVLSANHVTSTNRPHASVPSHRNFNIEGR